MENVISKQNLNTQDTKSKIQELRSKNVLSDSGNSLSPAQSFELFDNVFDNTVQGVESTSGSPKNWVFMP